MLLLRFLSPIFVPSVLFLSFLVWSNHALQFAKQLRYPLGSSCRDYRSKKRTSRNNDAELSLLLAKRQADTGADDGNDDKKKNLFLQELRRQLELSWNKESMGNVPTSPESAADAAAGSLLSAAMNRPSNSPSIFLVEILLPAYDITQGTNLYDEVLAIEFCIALARHFRGEKSLILMRDGETLQTVNRMLTIRSQQQLFQAESSENLDEEDEYDDADEEYDDNEDVLSYDDFQETAATPAQDISPKQDIDTFRRNLMSSWEGTNSEDHNDLQPCTKECSGQEYTTSKNKSLAIGNNSHYRLASFFGDATISSGADMADDAIRALKFNGKPSDDEDIIIIVSAVSPEEMICVRSLVFTYGRTKRIVLVNCKLNPLPRELIEAETVYSILPLIARHTFSEQNIFANTPNNINTSGGSNDVNSISSPKVVVLRRYPRDWEVYIDVGEGFELTASVAPSKVDKTGPSMEWISTSVKRHLQARFG